MDRQNRRELKREIRRAYKIHRIVETMPQRYRDVILEVLIRKTDWNKIQERYYYSERRMRDILNEALEEVRRRIEAGEKPEDFSDGQQ